jgi:PAS domain S-box-containing protein
MSFSTNADLAGIILRTVKAYAILILSRDGMILDWLGDAESVTGYGREDVVGKPLEIIFMEPDRASGAAAREVENAWRDGRAEDSRWHQRKDGTRFWANGLTLRLEGHDDLLVKIFRDETPLKRAEEHRVLLLNELNHRVKNTLATVQSIVEQTLRSNGVATEVRSDLSARVMALARAHNVLVDQNWAGADLEVLVRDIARPYERTPAPFTFNGPAVRLHPSQAVTLSLALHELATNAAKYGALSTTDGRVRVEWNLAHNGQGVRHLTLLWAESGGPRVLPPTRSGFGSRLIAQTFGGHEGGRARIAFEPDGVRCVMTLRLVDQEADNNEPPSSENQAP